MNDPRNLVCRTGLFIFLLFFLQVGYAQVSDMYSNPVIHADYSDPDAIRDGNKYYMVASSFNFVPGLPILESADLVNWTLLAYALPKLVPAPHFSAVQPGGGVWAPSIRKHKGFFYIYYPDPDFGIYMIRSANIRGPWSTPVMVMPGRGLIDPCPLWDNDGKVFLTFAFAGSRAGIKSVLSVVELDATGSTVTGQPVMVYDGHDTDPTVEGPKFYKRNGYYYIFAPAGGVSTGWQIVLRSRHIYGTYERRVVMAQGNSAVNGPHQGAWVNTPTGEDWFLHFQDKDAYGRIVHLQPMQWKNDWPVIGADPDGDGVGEPVSHYKRPGGIVGQMSAMNTSDEFNKPAMNLHWQWSANPDPAWAMPTNTGYLAMPAIHQPDSLSLFRLPTVLSQKFPAEKFTATVRINFRTRNEGERFHFMVLGTDYSSLAIERVGGKFLLVRVTGLKADKGGAVEERPLQLIDSGFLYLRITVSDNGHCTFSYSNDGKLFTIAGSPFTAAPGKWVGARIGMACTRKKLTNDAGWAYIDWVRFTE